MRDGDDLFFAPGIRFSEVDLKGNAWPEQYRARVKGFYFQPAELCIESKHAFAAGLLVLSAIDFMAGFHHSAESLEKRRKAGKVGAEFIGFVKAELQSFTANDLALRLWDEFRCGLSHEARIKNGGEFSFDRQDTAHLANDRLCVNPRSLLKEVAIAFDRQTKQLNEDEGRRKDAATRLLQHFAREFQDAFAAKKRKATNSVD